MEFRKLLKKDTPYHISKEIKEEFASAKTAIGRNILLNSFNVNRRSRVVTDASGDGLGHILLQQNEGGCLSVRAQASDNN